MGWSFTPGITRKQMIADRISSWQKEKDGATVSFTCIAHCYRGNAFSGVLWKIWERVVTKNGVAILPAERWIACAVLNYHTGAWGYKDMDESVHPYYYSCPLGYLEKAPVSNQEWRECVRSYHQRKKEKRLAKKLAKA